MRVDSWEVGWTGFDDESSGRSIDDVPVVVASADLRAHRRSAFYPPDLAATLLRAIWGWP